MWKNTSNALPAKRRD